MNKLTVSAVAGAGLIGAILLPVEAAQAVAPAGKVKSYSSCAKLLKAFPNGVAKNGKAANRAVRQGFYRPSSSKAGVTVYRINGSRLDRDKDGVACEQ